MTTSSMELGAKKIINSCLKVRKGEDLVILADNPNTKVGQLLAKAGNEAGGNVSLILINPLKKHAEDPPRPVVNALCNADAAVIACTVSLSNSKARNKATKSGTRIISIPGCEERLFQSEAILADFEKQSVLVHRIGNILSNSSIIHVTTDIGTDLTINLCGRKSVNQTGLAHEPSSWAPVPIIEAAVGPDENGVFGVIYVDGSIIPGGVPEKPVVVKIEEGRITSINGGLDAKKLLEFLNTIDHPNMYRIVEVGIGLNPNARIGKNLMAEDESQYGTMHFGFGEGSTFGMPISAPSHMDLVVRKPTIKISNNLLFKDEELVNDFLN